ncbi:SDR family oxidoreductase [Microtetraspora malaysiensis]|uniref:SDR family oxidoreductase n=1 Tax=Microtetraspora malaysiensis TaxID=161358 RepID=UPI003D933A00
MIVVTGATGKVGHELVRLLSEAGEQVTGLSRQSAPLPEGVRHSPADLAEPAGLKAAFDGADALFLLVAGEDPQAILDMAKAGGIRRVVLLSSQGAGTRPQAYRHAASFEDAVRGSGLDWTILRPGGFNSNAFAWAEQIRADRTAAAPFGDVGLPTIDPADIAEVAAVILREAGHAGRTYELTGPGLVTPRERAAMIGEALGAAVRFVEQTREEARAQMLQFMPEPIAEGTLAILGEPTAAEQKVSLDVQRILGRAPHTFADWAARNIAAFR